MTEVKLKVIDLFELKAQIEGFRRTEEIQKAEGVMEVKETIIYTGFANEKGITEGTRRIANKIRKVLAKELETIQEQRRAIQENKYDESIPEGQEPITKEEIAADKAKKDRELLEDEITISLEEIIDFDKVKDLSLSMNYDFLYEKVFKNY